jgi:hypothetical protein
MLVICMPAEQDAAGMWFAARLFPRESVRPGRVFLDMPSDDLNIPVGERDDSLAIVLGQGEYIYAAEVLDLPPDPDDFLIEVKVFKGKTK